MSDEHIEDTEEVGHKTVTLSIYQDEDPMSPRDWDNLTIIRGWHRRMTVGDGPDINSDNYDGFEDMISSLIEEYEDVRLLAPLFWYEHSGATCSMGTPMTLDNPTVEGLADFRRRCMDDAGWDSGVAGLVIVTQKRMEELGVDPERIEEAARSEVQEYASWLEGDVWGYVIEVDGEQGDSCWGFIGRKHVEEEGEAAFKSAVEDVKREIAALSIEMALEHSPTNWSLLGGANAHS